MAERIEVDESTHERLVDSLLDYSGVPRRDLFEYPYNGFESRDRIKAAESTLNKILEILNS